MYVYIYTHKIIQINTIDYSNSTALQMDLVFAKDFSHQQPIATYPEVSTLCRPELQKN